MRGKEFWPGAAALACLWIPWAHSSVLEQWDTAKLTKHASFIQIGEVTSKWSSWDPERRMVYTYIKLRVEKTLKGKSQQEILIRQPGGEANGYGMIIHGCANFRKGERALVFLKVDSDGAPSVVGLSQGKYRIFRSAATGEDMALSRARSNMEFYMRSSHVQVGHGSEKNHVMANPPERRIPLQRLVSEVTAAIQSEVALAQ